jgi:hypothetical protein
MLRTTILAVIVALGLSAPAVASAPAPKVTSVSLETATDGVPKGTVAIYFRTDRPLPRKAGGSILATAGLRKAQEASVATHNSRTRTYVAFTRARGLDVGERTTVHIAIDGREITRTVTLRRG